MNFLTDLTGREQIENKWDWGGCPLGEPYPSLIRISWICKSNIQSTKEERGRKFFLFYLCSVAINSQKRFLSMPKSKEMTAFRHQEIITKLTI